MKLKRTLFLSIFMMVAMCSIGGTVLAAPSKTFPPDFLDGTRINLYEKPYKYPANQAYHIWQGWAQENWSDLSSDGKVDFKAFTITLMINEEPVKLNTWKRHFKEINIDDKLYFDVMIKIFYVEFPAYYFEKGKYVFEMYPTNQPTRTVTIRFY